LEYSLAFSTSWKYEKSHLDHESPIFSTCDCICHYQTFGRLYLSRKQTFTVSGKTYSSTETPKASIMEGNCYHIGRFKGRSCVSFGSLIYAEGKGVMTWFLRGGSKYQIPSRMMVRSLKFSISIKGEGWLARNPTNMESWLHILKACVSTTEYKILSHAPRLLEIWRLDRDFEGKLMRYLALNKRHKKHISD